APDPPGRSAAAVTVLAGLLLTAACGRTPPGLRPAATTARRPVVESDDPPRRVRTAHGQRRVILIGLDGADWSLLDRLAATGRMPNLARLTREGRTARLKSAIPLLSPIIWTSI